jgi:uncharacterized protein (TIGR02145 family)
MKFRLLAITLLVALAVVGCKEDEGIVNNNFTLSSYDADINGDKLTLNSGQQVIAIDVTTETPNGKWDVSIPAGESWLSYIRKGNRVTLMAYANNKSGEVRSSWIEFSMGDNKRKIVVEQDYLVLNDNFTLSSDEADISSDKLTLNFEKKSIEIDVTPQDPKGKWYVDIPAEDSWLSYSYKGNKLTLTIYPNDQTDKVRSSWIEFSLGDNVRRIVVEQDYLRKLAFTGTEMSVGASADDNLSLPYTGNIALEELDVTTSPADVAWISNLTIADGAVTGTLQRNPSYDDSRSVDITLSAGEMKTTLSLTQNQLSGYPYIIDLSGADFADALIYEIWDEVRNVKVGELCKEYLHKYDMQQSKDIVNMRAVVAYPMLKSGGVDYANGFVVDNGGSVAWNTGITSSTPASDYITSYAAGTLAGAPTVIYRGEVDVRLTTTPPQGVPGDVQIVNAVLRPYIVTDTREGEAINGNMTETYTYKVVKVGTQYWMDENLKTTRFRDGTPIPTNISNSDWNVANFGSATSKAYTPGCLLTGVDNGSGGFTSNLDANSTAESAVTARNRYGVQYNWQAVVNKSATPDAAMTGPFTDMLSPEGWSVPTREEFERMIYYVSGVTALGGIPDPEDGSSSTGIHLPQISGLGSNETGLSIDGATRWRGNSGAWNSNTANFYTMSDYSFSASASTPQSLTVFRLYASSGSDYLKGYFLVGSTHYGINVRCIRK